MARARAIIVVSGLIALIERKKNGKLFYVFPGGGADDGESMADAARREVKEELGLNVEIGDLIANETYKGEVNEFFRATVVDGELGTGTGEEMNASEDSKSGSYRPVWVPLNRLGELTVHPESVVKLIEIDRES
jgi:8-oxo-dGTP diphosphatase